MFSRNNILSACFIGGTAVSLSLDSRRGNHSRVYATTCAIFGQDTADTLKQIIDKPIVLTAILIGKQNVFDAEFPSLRGRTMSGADLCVLSRDSYITYTDAVSAHCIKRYGLGSHGHVDSRVKIYPKWHTFRNVPEYAYVGPATPVLSGVYHVHPRHYRITCDQIIIGDLTRNTIEK